MIQYIYSESKLYTVINNIHGLFFIVLSILNFSFIQASGFDGDTLVTMSNGHLKPIKELKVGDGVIGYNSNLQPEINYIKCVCSFMVDATINITTKDNVSMSTGLMELFYLPIENQWVYAKDLKEGNYLLTADLECIVITNVEKHEGASILFLIIIENQHNFLISQGQYLVHKIGPDWSISFYNTF